MSEQLVGLGAPITVQQEVGDEPAAFIVRVGIAEHRLIDPEDLIAWGTLSRSPRNFHELVDGLYSVTDDGAQVPVDASDVRARVDRLRENALVIGIDLDGPDLTPLALRLRAVPLHRAVATPQPGDDGYQLGTTHRVLCVLDEAQWTTWADLGEARSVAHLAVGRATAEGREVTADDVASAFGDCLDLVRAGAAYFDAAVS